MRWAWVLLLGTGCVTNVTETVAGDGGGESTVDSGSDSAIESGSDVLDSGIANEAETGDDASLDAASDVSYGGDADCSGGATVPWCPSGEHVWICYTSTACPNGGTDPMESTDSGPRDLNDSGSLGPGQRLCCH